jgi:hypothetical protein
MTNNNTDTLIVTSTIQPSEKVPYLSLTDPQQRLFQTYCSLICWIKETIIKKIVLCDNSAAYGAFTGIASLAEQYNKSLEILVFRGNQEKTCLLGKGYGEGEIMKYVMEHSRLLGDHSTFYKITGRIFVEGFNDLHHNHANKGIVFSLKPHDSKWVNILLRVAGKKACISYCRHHIGTSFVNTTFYKCTKQYYKQNLMDQFLQVDDRCGYYLEHAFVLPLLEKGFDTFSKKPYLVGFSGTTNRLYGTIDYLNEVKNLAGLLLNNK